MCTIEYRTEQYNWPDAHQICMIEILPTQLCSEVFCKTEKSYGGDQTLIWFVLENQLNSVEF